VSALADLRSAVAFLTPFGQTRGGQTTGGQTTGGQTTGGQTPGDQSGPSPSPLTMTYFPLVGAGIGGLVGLTWWRARRLFPPLLSAALAVAADCAFTGALHLDGLADTADGLFAHVPTKDRLDIMAEPGVGSFAAVTLGVALATRLSALAALEPSPALLGALYCSSRSVMVIGSRSLPYARPEGLVSAFLPSTEGLPATEGRGQTDEALVAAWAGVAAALALASAVAGRRGAAAVVAGWGAAAVVLESARRRLGGYTGDVLGAAGVACETSGLVVAAGGQRG
jgi:adenosylcobinamide-GDP ribazoletransferase